MLKKDYGRSGKICKVTFRLPSSTEAHHAALCGDFNDWDPTRGLMERAPNGDFIYCLLLHPGKHYKFGYLLDGTRWTLEPEADDYETADQRNVAVVTL